MGEWPAVFWKDDTTGSFAGLFQARGVTGRASSTGSCGERSRTISLWGLNSRTPKAHRLKSALLEYPRNCATRERGSARGWKKKCGIAEMMWQHLFLPLIRILWCSGRARRQREDAMAK